MKQSIILILSIALLTASCVKDRIQPTNGPVVTSVNDTLMYYWDFNTSDSSLHSATFAVNPGATYSYFASYVDFTSGSALNLSGTSDAGNCLRVRNPSNSLIFYMPTTNFDSLQFSFDEQRSGSGSSQNLILYTVDGTNYISTAISNNAYIVDTTFATHTFDLSSDANIKHNPKFAVKIVFNNNNTGTSGNDRFDNITLKGKRE
jgi:hypothetical protein